MKKDAYYFSHDSNARNDIKITALRSIYGSEGYGWYFMILEIMREQEKYCINMNSKFAYASIATDLRADESQVKTFINNCVNEFDLFDLIDGLLFSKSLLARMEKLDAKRAQASEAARARWGKRKKPQDDESPPFGDEPVKKPKPYSLQKRLTNDSQWGEFKKSLMESDEFKSVPEATLDRERKRCIDWLKANGVRKKNYESFFKNWIRKNMDPGFNANTNTGGMVY